MLAEMSTPILVQSSLVYGTTFNTPELSASNLIALLQDDIRGNTTVLTGPISVNDLHTPPTTPGYVTMIAGGGAIVGGGGEAPVIGSEGEAATVGGPASQQLPSIPSTQTPESTIPDDQPSAKPAQLGGGDPMTIVVGGGGGTEAPPLAGTGASGILGSGVSGGSAAGCSLVQPTLSPATADSHPAIIALLAVISMLHFARRRPT